MDSKISDIIFDSLHEIAKQKGIALDVVVESFKESIFRAAVNVYKYPDTVHVDVNVDKREFRVMVQKEAVEEVEDEFYEVSLKEAKKYDKKVKPGDQIFVDVGLKDFGRNAIYITKQLVNQRIVEAEREGVFKNYKERIGDVVTGTVQQITRNDILISLGKADAILLNSEKIRKERYRPGDIVKGYIYEVREEKKGPQIFLSRTRNEFLKKLLMLEIPELYNGIVKVMGVARDPGNRAKISVYTEDNKIDPVGACVGMKGSRILNVVRELSNEQIDVVLWNSDLETYIARAIGKNVNVLKISRLSKEKFIVVVPDDELAKAIGKDGQNVRLSSQLVGYDLDVLKESEYNSLQQKKALSMYNNEEQDGEEKEEYNSLEVLPDVVRVALDNEEILLEDLKDMSIDDIAEKFDLSLDDLKAVDEFLKNN